MCGILSLWFLVFHVPAGHRLHVLRVLLKLGVQFLPKERKASEKKQEEKEEKENAQKFASAGFTCNSAIPTKLSTRKHHLNASYELSFCADCLIQHLQHALSRDTETNQGLEKRWLSISNESEVPGRERLGFSCKRAGESSRYSG